MGEYTELAVFIAGSSTDDEVQTDTAQMTVAKKLTAKMRAVMRASGVEYVEGDIFKGQMPMFEQFGFKPHPSRYLWVCQRVPAVQPDGTSAAGANATGRKRHCGKRHCRKRHCRKRHCRKQHSRWPPRQSNDERGLTTTALTTHRRADQAAASWSSCPRCRSKDLCA